MTYTSGSASAFASIRRYFRPTMAAFASILTLVALWSLTHSYLGLIGDAELYAVQAMTRIHPGLTEDVFLRHGSQDRFTLFSPLYAWCIRFLGLPAAALTLCILFKVWLFAACWALARAWTDVRLAFLALCLLVIADGAYGGYGVFRYAEDLLTARSLAEALVVSAVALHFYGLKSFGLLLALVALPIHPIMALPGLLLLLCVECSLRVKLAGAALGVLMTLMLSSYASIASPGSGFLTVLDPAWLDVVRERSIYLFLNCWSSADWATSARPLFCLAIATLVLKDPRVHRLSIAAGIVGVTGLAIALIAGALGHVAIIIQAQVWRWMWITCLLSVLLAAPAAEAVCREQRGGRLMAVLLVGGWLLPPILGMTCMVLCLLLWRGRDRIDVRAAHILRWGTVALVVSLFAWAAFGSWHSSLAPFTGSSSDGLSITRLKGIFGVKLAAFLICSPMLYWINTTRSKLGLASVIAAVATGAIMLIPGTFISIKRDDALTSADAFADWRGVIPPATSVYVAPRHFSAAFAWFTLNRPSYLTVDQSAGVVFSRVTAMEIQRRSEVLLPIMDPDWRLRTSIRTKTSGVTMSHGAQPLTQETLARLCHDPQLGFVIATDQVSPGPVSRKQLDNSEDWSLYDCEPIRSAAPLRETIH
jgi:hypothetical protein